MAWLCITVIMTLFVFPAIFRMFARLALAVLLVATCMAANHHDITSALVLVCATGLIGAFSGLGFRRTA